MTIGDLVVWLTPHPNMWVKIVSLPGDGSAVVNDGTRNRKTVSLTELEERPRRSPQIEITPYLSGRV